MMTEMVTAAEVERSIFFVEGLVTSEDRAEMRHWQALADLAPALAKPKTWPPTARWWW